MPSIISLKQKKKERVGRAEMRLAFESSRFPFSFDLSPDVLFSIPLFLACQPKLENLGLEKVSCKIKRHPTIEASIYMYVYIYMYV